MELNLSKLALTARIVKQSHVDDVKCKLQKLSTECVSELIFLFLETYRKLIYEK